MWFRKLIDRILWGKKQPLTPLGPGGIKTTVTPEEKLEYNQWQAYIHTLINKTPW